MTRKIIVVVVCFTAIITRAGAQEMGIVLDGGLQGTQYQLQNGQRKPLPGGSLGLYYTFRLSSRWGLLSGITGGLYRTQVTLPDGVVSVSDQVDDAGSAFQYSEKTLGYTETQQFFAAGIPLLLQYHTTGTSTQWYFDGGGKVLFPFNASTQISAQQITLSGYYPDLNLNVSNLPQHGFSTLKGWRTSASADLRPAAVLSAATGISFGLSATTRLYTGLYVDYGLTDLRGKKDSMPLVTYSSTGVSGVQANSVLNTPNAGQVTSLSFGVQMRLTFGSARAKPTAQQKSKTALQQQAKPTIRARELEVIQMPVVFGSLGETSISLTRKLHLYEVARIMRQYPDIRVSIVGHTCNEGAQRENPKVGRARAKAVARYLQDNGIDRSRMDISFVRESDPGLTNDRVTSYQNRRVAITVE